MGRKKNERGVRQEHKKGESKRMRREKEERRRRKKDENPGERLSTWPGSLHPLLSPSRY